MILRLAFGNDYVPIHATPSLPVLAFACGASFYQLLVWNCSSVDDGKHESH